MSNFKQQLQKMKTHPGFIAAPDHTAAASRAQRTVLERKLPPKAGLAIEGDTA